MSLTTDQPLVAFECTLQGVALGQLLPRSTRYSLSWTEGPLDEDPGAIDPHLWFFVTTAFALVQLLDPLSFPRASIIPRDASVLLWPRCSPQEPTLSQLLSPSLTSLFTRLLGSDTNCHGLGILAAEHLDRAAPSLPQVKASLSP